jgi:hypothetical protein
MHRINPFASTLGNIEVKGIMYQPIWIFVSAFISWVGHAGILLSVYLFKLLSLAAHLSVAILLVKLADITKTSDKSLPPSYLLNPLFLFEFVGQGHFDLLMMSFVMASLIFLFRRQLLLSSLFLAAALNIKITTLIFIPLIAFYIWNVSGMEGLKSTFVVGVPFVAVTIITYVPFWGGFSTLNGLKSQSKWVVNSLFSGIYSLAGVALQKLGRFSLLDHYVPRVLNILSLLLPAFAIFKMRNKVWKWVSREKRMSYQDFLVITAIALMIYVLVIQRSYWPWYLALIFPLTLLLDSKSIIRKLSTWLTVSGLAYYVFYLLVGYIAVSNLMSQFLITIILFFPVLLLFKKEPYKGGASRFSSN